MMKLVRKECRRSISERVYYSTRRSAQEHSSNGVDVKKEVKRRANVLRATWNQVTDQNDLVKEILEFLKDYPDRAIR